MTIIFGVLSDQGAYLASDTMTFHGSGGYSGHSKKISVLPSKQVAIALAGYHRTTNIIAENAQRLDRAFEDGGVGQLVRDLRKLTIDDGHMAESSKGPWDASSCMLIGTRTALYEIGSCFSYTDKEIGQPAAYGVGMDFSLGAWSATAQVNPDLTIIDRLRLCLSAAFEHCSGTGGRIAIWQCGGELTFTSHYPMTYRGALHDGC